MLFMNIIYSFFDEQYVIKLFKKKVLPKYSDFVDVKKIKIKFHKKNIWETTYHVVVEFKTYFLTKNNKIKILPIFCSAHSNEPRKSVYYTMKYLWNNNFSKSFLTMPHPLFYSNYFKAIFYRGVPGNNLYYYIKNKDYKALENIIPKIAAWFVKLHKLPINNDCNFNKTNNKIRTVRPGAKHILNKIKIDYPDYYNVYKKIYSILIINEEKFLSSTQKRWVIHGDAHPENIIKMGKKKIAGIDFADIGLSDFARDLGSFTQQLEYMCIKKMYDEQYAEKLKNIFLENYLINAKIKLNSELKQRIKNYYNWTAVRTATFHIIKHNPDPERSKSLIEHVTRNILT